MGLQWSQLWRYFLAQVSLCLFPTTRAFLYVEWIKKRREM